MDHKFIKINIESQEFVIIIKLSTSILSIEIIVNEVNNLITNCNHFLAYYNLQKRIKKQNKIFVNFLGKI